MNPEQQKRLEEIRHGAVPDSIEGVVSDIGFLLEQLAERDARIAELENMVVYIKKHSDLEGLMKENFKLKRELASKEPTKKEPQLDSMDMIWKGTEPRSHD